MAVIPRTASAGDLLRTLYAIAFVVEARDPYTGGHLWRVSQYAGKLAAPWWRCPVIGKLEESEELLGEPDTTPKWDQRLADAVSSFASGGAARGPSRPDIMPRWPKPSLPDDRALNGR